MTASEDKKPEEHAERYSADAPVKDPDHDRFGRWPFGQRVGQVIAHRRDPSSIVVGIYGAWGEGKTTLLNFVERELSEHEHIVVFPFNPWRFGDEETLLRGFFVEMAGKLERSLTTRSEDIGELIKKYAQPVAGILGRGDAAEGFANLLGQADLEEIRERIDSVLTEVGRRVVVLIDDIDRLEKEEIHSVFRLVKLTADFKNTAYVLAFDDEMVTAALQERYGTHQPGAGRSFLEKIVQVPLHLPAADPIALRQFCFEGVDQALSDAQVELTEEQVQDFGRRFVDAFDGRLGTPRMAKLYSNILSFSLPILKGEVHPVDLMLVEGMRVFYPTLYAHVRDHPVLVLGELLDLNRDKEEKKQSVRERLEKGFTGLDADARDSALKLLLGLFPQLNSVYSNISYGAEMEDKWALSQRIAAREYFPRYFSYAINERDVPDETVRGLIAAADYRSPGELRERLREVVQPRNAEKFVWKLRRREHTASPTASRALALALAGAGALFPKANSLFSFLEPRSQIAISIANLIENLPSADEREELAVAVLHEAESLGFALECFWRFHVFDEEQPDQNAFTAAQRERLGRSLARRIAAEAQERPPLFADYPDEVPGLLYAWSEYGAAGEARSHIRAALQREPRVVLDLMRSFLPTSWGSSGIARRGDFERSQYDSLIKIIEPEAIEEALREHIGERFVVPDNFIHFEEGIDADLKLALQFAWLRSRLSTERPEREFPTAQEDLSAEEPADEPPPDLGGNQSSDPDPQSNEQDTNKPA